MTIVDWFDPYDEVDMKAWKYLNNTGFWPSDFIKSIPSDIVYPPAWQVLIAGKLADAWTSWFLTKHEGK